MKKINILLTVSFGLAMAIILSLLLYVGGYVPNFLPMSLITLAALYFVIAGVRTLTSYSAQNDSGKSILFLTLGGAVGYMGEFYNFIKLYSGEGVSALSLADAFYFPAMISLVIGFYFAIRANKIVWNAKKRGAFGIWTIIMGILLVTVFYLATGRELANIQASIGYFIFVSILSLMGLRVFMVTWEYRGGSIFRAWFSVFLGICLLIVTVFYLFMTIDSSFINLNYTYTSLSLLAISEIAVAYGIAVLGSVTKDIQSRVLNQIQ